MILIQVPAFRVTQQKWECSTPIQEEDTGLRPTSFRMREIMQFRTETNTWNPTGTPPHETKQFTQI